MFCRKCGNKLPDNSLYCPKCGTKVKILDEYTKPSFEKQAYQNNSQAKARKQINKLVIKIIIFTVAVVLGIIITLNIVDRVMNCDSSFCHTVKAEGSNYCSVHTCQYKDCGEFKQENDIYCLKHTWELICIVEDCNNMKKSGSEYCSEHGCAISDCSNIKYEDTIYCEEHQSNVRGKLAASRFSFDINSAGGIEFAFSANNSSRKEIKCIRFPVYLYDVDGNLLEEEFSDEYTVDVEIIGTFGLDERITFKETIGYAKRCAKIEIRNITILYSDGSIDTGPFDYYYKR